MGDRTGISWTDTTWNPIRGCSRVSEGCRNCYAETMAARFCGPGEPYEGLADRTRKGSKWTGDVRFIVEHLADPLHWKRPRRIFVNSMSDLFHDSLQNEQIAAVFGVMAACPQHTFQVLTKRAERMLEWFEWMHSDPLVRLSRALTTYGLDRHVHRMQAYGPNDRGVGNPWPLVNVWLGVSCESQEHDDRIAMLCETPAAVRFISAEPLLGPLDIAEFLDPAGSPCGENNDVLDWVIAGCESGPGMRPCNVGWLRSLRDQCQGAGVPFFLKQAVETPCGELNDSADPRHDSPMLDVIEGDGSKRKARGVIELPYLDGEQHAEFPT